MLSLRGFAHIFFFTKIYSEAPSNFSLRNLAVSSVLIPEISAQRPVNLRSGLTETSGIARYCLTCLVIARCTLYSNLSRSPLSREEDSRVLGKRVLRGIYTLESNSYPPPPPSHSLSLSCSLDTHSSHSLPLSYLDCTECERDKPWRRRGCASREGAASSR